MHGIEIDFNNMLSFNVGKEHSVSKNELDQSSKTILKAHKHLRSLIENPRNRVSLGLEWTQLPLQDREKI